MGKQQIDQEFLEILACPRCQGSFTLDGEWLVCQGECKHKYPIKDGIPMLRLEDGVAPATSTPAGGGAEGE